MPSPAEQAAAISNFVALGRYDLAYEYIAQQINGDPAWDQNLVDWFEDAADINGSEPNFLKDWVFTSNALAAGLDPNSPAALQLNQQVSDGLAQQIISDYLESIQGGEVLSPAEIFQMDVNAVAGGFDVPQSAWAGGPLGALYGFPVGEIYDSIGDLAPWLINALETAAVLAGNYASELLEHIPEIADAIDNFIMNMPQNLAGMLEWLEDHLADILGDPLVLDLDGDGIELVALAQSAALFDLDGDGALERTGWVSPQDGFLVQDSNGNDLVDGVAELFGSANVDGYDELRTLDSNGDGRINSADPAFAQLRVWRDLNSDGLSTANELQTLADAGIASLNLGYSQVNQDVSGNVIARDGNYTRADGTTRGMASVNFALDEITPVIPQGADLSDLAMLPNLSGQLGLPDLRTAMYFDPTLRDMVEDLTYGSHDFDTFAEFRDGGFLDMLYRWAGIDTSDPLEPGEQPFHIQLLSAFMGSPFGDLNGHQVERLTETWGAFVGQLGTAFLVQAADLPAIQPFFQMQMALEALSPDEPGFEDALSALLSDTIAASNAAQPAYDYLNLFEQLDLDLSTGHITGDFDAFLEKFLEDQPPYDPGVKHLFIRSMFPVEPSLWVAWYNDQGSFLYSVASLMGYGSDYVDNATGWGWLRNGATLVEGTNDGDVINVVSPGNQAIFGFDGDDELRGNDGNDSLMGGDGNDHLFGGSGSDMYIYATGDDLDRITEESGSDDTIYFSHELNRDALQVTRVSGTNDMMLHFGDPTRGIVITNQWTSSGGAVDHFNFGSEGTLHAGDISSLYLATLATVGADIITGSWANEQIVGLDGNDTLSGADGSDTVDGGSGNDTVRGGSHNDIAIGGLGDDLLQGEHGHDRLIGGAGNDRMEGGDGGDTYVYNLSDGDDSIWDCANWDVDNPAYLDTLIFGTGITASNIVLSRVDGDGADMRISFTGEAGSILLDNQHHGNAGIETFQFADGTAWNLAQIMARYMADQQTPGNDTIWGSYMHDVASGGDGDDAISTYDGNDTLIGGIGRDSLQGGTGTDIFRFAVGDSEVGANADTILDFASGSDKIDLSAIDAQLGLADDQAFSFIGTAAFTQQEGQLRYLIEGSNRRLQADVDGDGMADFEIILTGTAALSSSDFML